MTALDVERRESLDAFRVPSQRSRCARPRCPTAPVADMARQLHRYATGRTFVAWWGYCERHLAEYGREVRADGCVWWVPALFGGGVRPAPSVDGDGIGDV